MFELERNKHQTEPRQEHVPSPRNAYRLLPSLALSEKT